MINTKNTLTINSLIILIFLVCSSFANAQNLNYCNSLVTKSIDLMWKKERFLYFSFLGFILFLLILVLIIFRYKTIRNRQCKQIDQRNQEIILLKLQKEIDDNLLSKKKEEIALLEQARLKNEIELRNQKIAAKALYLSGRDQLLKEILKSLGKAEELSKNRTLKNHIRELKSHLNTEDDWNSFVIHFEEVNQGLLQKLKTKHPELNQNDLRFISYEYMNLSTKEIATLLNITLDACRKRRERIVTKLGIASSSELNYYLSNI